MEFRGQKDCNRVKVLSEHSVAREKERKGEDLSTADATAPIINDPRVL